MSLWSGTALCPEWASSWWCWAGVSSSLGRTEKVRGGSGEVGDHPSLSWSGRAEADAGSLHLSESRPGPCACSQAAAWCRAQRARRTRRTPRGAGSSHRYSVAPLVMRRLCPRCPQPSPDPECPPWDRQNTSVMSNAEDLTCTSNASHVYRLPYDSRHDFTGKEHTEHSQSLRGEKSHQWQHQHQSSMQVWQDNVTYIIYF